MLNGTNILLVDDEPKFVNTLIWVLTDDHATVDSAGSVEEGLNKLHNNLKKFDVILLDLFLPNGKGPMVVSKFQQITPDIPIVVITGMEHPDLEREALRLGAQDILIKGDIKGERLISTIFHAIERHKVRKTFEPLIKILEKAEDTLNKMQKLTETQGS